MTLDFRPHDAHAHLDQNPEGLTGPADLVAAMDAVGVETAAVVVTQPMGVDNSTVLDAVAQHPGRFVSILKLDVHAEHVVDTATELLDRGARGVRFTIFNDDNIQWLTDGSVAPLLSLLAQRSTSLTFHCRPDQLDAVGRVARTYEGLPVIIDHLGRPDVAAGPQAQPFEHYLSLAALPNVLTKTPASSFFSAEGPPYLDLVPFLERALESFGARRVLWGTDWPVVDYALALQPVVTLLKTASGTERRAVLRDNFERIFCG